MDALPLMTKQDIIAEIRRTAAANGGKPLGVRRFATETGIREHEWCGRFWVTWGDALREAGYDVNPFQRSHPDDHLLECYARLIRELNRIPRLPELAMKRIADPSFPSEKAFRRFNGKARLLARLRTFCEQHPDFGDVLDMLEVPDEDVVPEPRSSRLDPPVSVGFVYLIRFGRHYKIGHTNAVGRRERELAIQLPDKTKTVHIIRTDDPEGIEAYWHRRFAAKRGNGEWFALDTADISAFRRRKFM